MRNASVILRFDNTTAVCYINKSGGTKSKRDMCKWYEERDIELQEFYLRGLLNVLADQEMWKEQKTGDWKL